MVFVMIVTLEIRDECVAEFLEIMKADAVGSRTEPGCVRFDLLQSGPNTFVLYEAYENDAAAVAAHKETEHYKAWSAFKAREPSPVLSQYVAKSKAVDFTC